MPESDRGGPEPSLHIDLNRLEEEAARHPAVVREWGLKLVAARRRTKGCKAAFKLLGARIGQEFRETCGYKPTVDAVEAAVLTHPEHENAQRDLFDAEEDEETLEVYMKALAERGYQITNEVTLHGQTYWSKPYTGSAPPRNAAAAAALRRDVTAAANAAAGGSRPKKT